MVEHLPRLTAHIDATDRRAALQSIKNDHEEWAILPQDPRYQVSSLGRVIGPKGRILKPQKNGTYGYLGVSIGKAGGRQYVHRLVMAAFIGDRPEMDVDHQNGDVSDNSLANLRYLTHAENMRAQRERKPRCRRGHSFSDAYWYRGRRSCRTCMRDRESRRNRSKKKA